MPRPIRPARVSVEGLETRQLLATFVVTNTNDSGAGSLRQAMLDANADGASSTATFPETINFAIPGSETPTIAPTSPLPTLTEATSIDATTQSGSKSTIGVILDGVNAIAADGSPVDGLTFSTNGTVDSGLVGGGASGLEIIRFSGSAINNVGPGRAYTDLALGSDLTGQPDLGNAGYGIKFDSLFGGNTIADSVIAHNGLRGISGAYDSPTDPSSFPSGYTATNVIQSGNDTRGTVLTVSTPTGQFDDYFVAYGSDQTLSFTVTNTGANPATNVTPLIADGWMSTFGTLTAVTTTQGTVTWNGQSKLDSSAPVVNFGTIAPGASATVTLTVHVTDTPQANPGNFSWNSNSDIFNAGVQSPEFDYDSFSTRAWYTLTATPDGQPPSNPGGPILAPGPIVNNPPPNGTGTPPGTGILIDPGPIPVYPIAVPGGSAPNDGTTNPVSILSPQPILVTPYVAPDLAVTSVAPTAPVVAGQPTTLTFNVTNSGGVSRETDVLIDLSALPAGSTYTFSRSNSDADFTLSELLGGSASNTPAPVLGRPGVYKLNLGQIQANRSASVSVVVTPTTSSTLAVTAEASDFGNPAGDPTPLNNVALAMAPIAAAPTTSTTTATVATANTVQITFATVLNRTQAQKLSHYQLTTATGATVPIRSAQYNAKTHRVTLRLAHPLPVGTSQARLGIKGLGADADLALSFNRKGRHR